MSGTSEPRVFERYGPGAQWYDVLSMERAIYRAGRVALIEALHIAPGERVLDIGCGTGLSLPLLAEAVGDTGQIVGLDPSARMLAQADKRVAEAAWGPRVRLVAGPANKPPSTIGSNFDVALFAYSLGVMDDWREAWEHAVQAVRPGGRIGVVDTDWPAGPWRVLTPAAAGAFVLGGVHPSRQVWKYLRARTVHSTEQTLRGGHVRLATGTVTSTEASAETGAETGT
ncbi:MAG: methyltransferase domain-containing protein [Allobranchiibius sp.]